MVEEQDEPRAVALHSDLDRHRDKIIRLYLVEKRRLKDVMDILREEDGCKATINMYKKRIKAWNIEKRNKNQDMVEFLADINKRKAQGLPPITRRIRGRDIDEEEVKRYFRRKGGLKAHPEINPDPIAEGMSGPSTIKMEPGQNSMDFMSMVPFHQMKQEPGQFYPSYQQPHIQRSLTLPEIFRIPNDLFAYISMRQRQVLQPLTLPPAAFDGTQDENAEDFKAIVLRRKSIVSYHMDTLFDMVEDGVTLLNEHKYTLGFAALERGFREIRQGLLQPSPANLTTVPKLLLMTIELGQPAVGEMLAKYVCEQARSLYGRHHPLTCWAELLLQRWNFRELLQAAIQANCDATNEVFGIYDSWSLALRYSVLDSRVGMENMSVEEINQRFETLIRDCGLSNRVNVRVYINCQRMYGTHLASNGRYAAAEKVLENVPTQAQTNYPDRRDIDAALYALDDLAGYVSMQGNYARAESYWLLALNRAKEIGGQDNSVTMHMLQRCGKFYRDHGRALEADKLYNELSDILQPFSLSKD